MMTTSLISGNNSRFHCPKATSDPPLTSRSHVDSLFEQMIKPVGFFFPSSRFYFSVIVKLPEDTKASELVEAERAIRHWESNMVKQEASSQSIHFNFMKKKKKYLKSQLSK